MKSARSQQGSPRTPSPHISVEQSCAVFLQPRTTSFNERKRCASQTSIAVSPVPQTASVLNPPGLRFHLLLAPASPQWCAHNEKSLTPGDISCSRSCLRYVAHMPLVLCPHFSGACAYCDFVPQGMRSEQRVQGGAGLLYAALGRKHIHTLCTPHVEDIWLTNLSSEYSTQLPAQQLTRQMLQRKQRKNTTHLNK